MQQNPVRTAASKLLKRHLPANNEIQLMKYMPTHHACEAMPTPASLAAHQ